MNDKISQTIEKYSMLANGDTVLVALSGGADSVLLTEYLLSVKEKFNLTIIAAHVEHGIRGADSLADCCFCENYCNDKDIRLFTKHINAPKEAESKGVGIEEYSRQARYDFFNSIKCDKIATAHNLSDNAETLLFRLTRGTSLRGACAIPPVRGKIIRPLINVTSTEIRNYLDDNGIAYCVDRTNFENDYARNKIRNIIIPELKKINPAFEFNVSNFISSAADDEAYLDGIASEIFDLVCKNNEIDCDNLNQYDLSIIRRVIAKWLNNNKLNVNTYILSKTVFLLNKSSSFTVAKGVNVASAGGKLKLFKTEKRDKFKFIVDKKIIHVKEFLTICEFNSKCFDFYCDCDKIIGSVKVRSRIAGDAIAPKGRNCTKSLKKFYNELHIPAEKRAKVPVVADEHGVIGICGYAVSQRVAVDGNTQNVLILNIRTEDFFNE